MTSIKNNFKTWLLVGTNLILLLLVLTSAVSNSSNGKNTNTDVDEHRGADPLLGEISMFAGNFAPRGYAFCNGQLLPISQYSALFSILGTTYGGDGRTSFALPDLRGRAPIHAGQGPGLSGYSLGQKGGRETVTLTLAQLPAHNHGISIAAGSSGDGDANAISAVNSSSPTSATIGEAGGGQSVAIVQPYQAVHYIIALNGVFPSRN